MGTNWQSVQDRAAARASSRLDDDKKTGVDFRLTDEQKAQMQDLANQFRFSQNVGGFTDKYGRWYYRTPWLLTTERAKAAGEPPISFYINPSQYTLETPIRQAIVQTKGGPIIHNFRDAKRGGTNFGFSTMQITFNTGSMLPRYYPKQNKEKTIDSKLVQKTDYEVTKDSMQGMPQGLENLYDYVKLIQEDHIYKDASGTPKDNYHILVINTLAFPWLQLHGFFNENVNIPESAENPAEIEWTGTFLVYKTIPALTLNQLTSLKNSWKSEMIKAKFDPANRKAFADT